MGMESNGRPNKTNSVIIKHPNLNATPRQKDCIVRLSGLKKFPEAIVRLAGAHHAINALVHAKNAKKDMKHVVLPAICFYEEYNSNLEPKSGANFTLGKVHQSHGIEVYQLAGHSLDKVQLGGGTGVERGEIDVVKAEEASGIMSLEREI